VLVVEVTGEGGDVRRTLVERLPWARLDEVRVVERVPVDHRHNAKVDYPQLARMLG
jgi:hypothetical protein